MLLSAAAPLPLTSDGTRSILIWSGILIAMILVMFVGYSYFRKWMTQTEETGHGSAFGLSDLRELHKQGKISTEEYEMTRARLIVAAKRMTDKMPDVTPKRPRPRNAADGDVPPDPT